MSIDIIPEMTEEQLISNLTNNVSRLFVPQADLVLAVIRSHLYTEFLIEQVINNYLPKGEKISVRPSQVVYSGG